MIQCPVNDFVISLEGNNETETSDGAYHIVLTVTYKNGTTDADLKAAADITRLTKESLISIFTQSHQENLFVAPNVCPDNQQWTDKQYEDYEITYENLSEDLYLRFKTENQEEISTPNANVNVDFFIPNAECNDDKNGIDFDKVLNAINMCFENLSNWRLTRKYGSKTSRWKTSTSIERD